MSVNQWRTALADRLCWSAYTRDHQIYLYVQRVAHLTPGMTEDQADVLVRSGAVIKLESAIIDLIYAIAAAVRPLPTDL